jgi:hypothetical protein
VVRSSAASDVYKRQVELITTIIKNLILLMEA